MERPERLSLQSADGAQLNLDALYQIAPSCFTEATDPKTGKIKRVINFDVLRQLLGDDTVEDATEAYEFNWVGKQEARAEVLRPINKTLRPVKEDSVDWNNTQNLYIEGDNLEVLKLLQKSYLGKVKMIYIDPPYNTGNDFVYHDDSSRSQEEEDLAAGNIDELGNRYRKNTDSNGRFHSEWCSMIYTRLMVARSLLTTSGYICISIDDNEVENIKKIANEVFGESNFVAQFIIIRSEGGGLAKRAVIGHDYMVVFAKDIENCRSLGRPKDIRGKIVQRNGEDYWIETDWFREVFGRYGTCHYEDILQFYNQSKKDEIDEGLANGNYVLIPRDGKHIVGRYRKVAEDTSKFYTILKHLNKNGVADLQNLSLNKFFDYPKPVSLVKEFIQGVTILSKNDSEIIIDFFSGSATTAQAVMQLNAEDGGNRKFIMVQLPEETPENSDAREAGYNTIPEIAKERIRRAGKKIKEEHPEAKDLDTGFRVFRVDESNFEDVERTPKEYNQDQLDLLLNNVKSDRNDLDLLFGCMLDWGVKLSLPMSSEEVDGKMIYTVNDGDLVACFAEKVTDKVVKAMAEKQPLRVIFRDSCFEQDADKINIYETFKQLLDWSDKDVEKNIRVI
ncbi:MAG: site-specific DNA-methyltransferase [Bacteroidales bacterium]|nr:site-specific DNA-methyltransferase [Bacteroidales bacterium]